MWSLSDRNSGFCTLQLDMFLVDRNTKTTWSDHVGTWQECNVVEQVIVELEHWKVLIAQRAVYQIISDQHHLQSTLHLFNMKGAVCKILTWCTYIFDWENKFYPHRTIKWVFLHTQQFCMCLYMISRLAFHIDSYLNWTLMSLNKPTEKKMGS